MNTARLVNCCYLLVAFVVYNIWLINMLENPVYKILICYFALSVLVGCALMLWKSGDLEK